MSDYDKCVAGCKHFTGGEVHHHKDCPQYPESMSRVYDEMESKIKELEKPKRQPLADGTLWLTRSEKEELKTMLNIPKDETLDIVELDGSGIKVWYRTRLFSWRNMDLTNVKAILYLADRFNLTEGK